MAAELLGRVRAELPVVGGLGEVGPGPRRRLGEDSGHQVLRVFRTAARKAKIPLTPATVAALDAYLADRAARAGAGEWRQLSGPLLATAAGGRLRQGHLWDLVRRLARMTGVGGGSRSRRTHCAIRRSPSPWTPAAGVDQSFRAGCAYSVRSR